MMDGQGQLLPDTKRLRSLKHGIDGDECDGNGTGWLSYKTSRESSKTRDRDHQRSLSLVDGGEEVHEGEGEEGGEGADGGDGGDGGERVHGGEEQG